MFQNKIKKYDNKLSELLFSKTEINLRCGIKND